MHTLSALAARAAAYNTVMYRHYYYRQHAPALYYCIRPFVCCSVNLVLGRRCVSCLVPLVKQGEEGGEQTMRGVEEERMRPRNSDRSAAATLLLQGRRV